MTKDFKYTIKTKEGKILSESVVVFGTEEHPFPKDWKNDYAVQNVLQDYKRKILEDTFDIEISEDTTFSLKGNDTEREKLEFALTHLRKCLSPKNTRTSLVRQIAKLNKELTKINLQD